MKKITLGLLILHSISSFADQIPMNEALKSVHERYLSGKTPTSDLLNNEFECKVLAEVSGPSYNIKFKHFDEFYQVTESPSNFFQFKSAMFVVDGKGLGGTAPFTDDMKIHLNFRVDAQQTIIGELALDHANYFYANSDTIPDARVQCYLLCVVK